MKKQIIIDNDGGTDDFVAILYAFLSKKFDVKAISLVAGNTDVNNVKENVFKALEMAGVTPEEAEKIGCKTINGLGMMLYQGAASFKLWTDQDMPIDVVKEALDF